MQLLFSVLIPVYNTGKYLEKCLDSILGQTYQNFEIIVTDDGSTDGSGRVADELAKKDARIRVVHQSNRGLLMTRRTQIPLARGDYILFLDSDDYWEKDTLETVLAAINKFDSDLVIFNFQRVSESGDFLCENANAYPHETVFEGKEKDALCGRLLFTFDINSLCRKAIKRELVLKDELDYEKYSFITSGEDVLQSLEPVMKSNKIVYLARALYHYRSAPASMTRSFSDNAYKSMTAVRQVGLDYLKKHGLAQEDNVTRLYNFYIKYVLGLLKISFAEKSTYRQKKQLIAQIKEEKFLGDALKYYRKAEYSRIDRLEIHLLQKRSVFVILAVNALLMNGFVCKGVSVCRKIKGSL